LLHFIKGVLATLTLVANTLVGFTLMMPVALIKLAVPWRPVRVLCDRWINGVATGWIAVNNAWIAAVGHTHWDVQGLEGLRPDGWYLLASNHQSWVDILVLQRVFTRRIPLLKFFLKKELIWVPVIGLAWWALDFPFMQRRGGSRSAEDLERARKACEKFRRVPTTVINFLEGTRFTPAKQRSQGSPFARLLKPKVGGIATAMATLGDRFETLLDVTIAYPDGPPTFWQMLSGRVHRVIVRVNTVPIPHEFTVADYTSDPAQRQRMQQWVNALWTEKDAQLQRLLPTRG
jgi:1-acyl-sn-glycerol-3-phosphate acyltransferase